jgi:sulfatase modifying factor 1
MKQWRLLLILAALGTLVGCPTAGSDPTTAVRMKLVPAGTFQRDSTSANTSTVAAFHMSETEITRAQFVAVTGLTDPSDPAASTGTDNPVQQANWYHSLVFCNRLSMSEGLTPVYGINSSTDPAAWGTVPLVSDATWDAATANWSASGYRLPTEMEWMWAAMGATSGSGYSGPTYLTGYGKLFAGSNSTQANGSGGTNVVGDWAWYNMNSGTTTHPVATTGTPANSNELGLYDMSGNVWEWCWDWAAAIPGGPLTDYRGAVSGTQRISRGGGWNSLATVVTVAFRSLTYPYNQGTMIGFRVVRR